MKQNMKRSFFPGLIGALVVILAFGSLATSARAQKSQANAHVDQQPLYSDYKGHDTGRSSGQAWQANDRQLTRLPSLR